MVADFLYDVELGKFLQIFLLGMILSTLVMYVTEAVKKWLIAFSLFKMNKWAISIVCCVLSMGFGYFWKMSFAADSIDWYAATWLGILLFLGSTGLYVKLENSDGFWGKTVKSYSDYIDTDAFVESLTNELGESVLTSSEDNMNHGDDAVGEK